MTIYLQYGSAIFAFIAATLWFWSASVNLPTAIKHIDHGDFSDDKPKPIDDMDRLTFGLSFQSRLSGFGAIAAGISAALQGILIFLSS